MKNTCKLEHDNGMLNKNGQHKSISGSVEISKETYALHLFSTYMIYLNQFVRINQCKIENKLIKHNSQCYLIVTLL